MPQRPKVLMRCPVCFSHENDVVMVREGEDGFYCVKCGFRGGKDVVCDMYDDLRKKYRLIHTRVTVEDMREM
jgi:Zn ribbon nucleic-acid-binding protein